MAGYYAAPESIPQRKPWHRERQAASAPMDEQHAHNRTHAKCCAKVAHAFNGSKWLCCVTHAYRNIADSFINRVSALACGVCNWYLTYKAI